MNSLELLMKRCAFLVFILLILQGGVVFAESPRDKTLQNRSSWWFMDFSNQPDGAAVPTKGWSLKGNIETPPVVCKSKFGDVEGGFLRLENREGCCRFVRIPIRRFEKKGKYEFIIEAAVETGTGPGLYLFVHLGTMLDLRVDEKGVYLQRGKKDRTMLGLYEPGTILTVRLQLDTADQTIDRIWINNEPVTDFTGMDWLSSNSPCYIELISSTLSGKDMYIRRLSIEQLVEGSNEARWVWQKRPVHITDMGQEPKEPPNLEPVSAEDIHFDIDPNRIKAIDYLGKNAFIQKAQLLTLPDRIKNDPRAAATWNYITNSAREYLTAGGSDNVKNKGKLPRYIYQLGGRLPRFAFLYMVTGEKHLGIWIRESMLDVIRRPMSFWVHDEIRHYDPEYPVGRLETSGLTCGIALALQWAPDLFTDEELQKIRTALRERGLYPCMRWLDDPDPLNNFVAVIGNGALIGAIVLDDKQAIQQAQDVMLRWIQLVEPDGSYGEQIEYFQYGCSSLIRGLLFLGPDRAKELVQNTPLRHSLKWLASYFSLARDKKGTPIGKRINFGDDDFIGVPNQLVCYFLAYAFDQGEATWLTETFHSPSYPYDFYTFLLRLMTDESTLPKPVDLSKAGWPTVMAFDNGVGILRSGWTMTEDLVLGLRSGGGAKTNYSHDVANRNAIALFVDGQYMLVAPGRACYRSPLRKSWDYKTSSQNTITIGGKNQIRKRKALIVCHVDDSNVGYLLSDATGSYTGVALVCRHVLFVRDPGYFVVWDEVNLKAPDTIQWHMHFSNYDGKSVLEHPADRTWHFTRNGVSLVMDVASSAEVKTSLNKDGIMHKGYSYLPGGPNEGTPGTAFALELATQSKLDNTQFCTVIIPCGKDVIKELAVDLSRFGKEKNLLTIRGKDWEDEITFSPSQTNPGSASIVPGSIRILRHADGVETFTTWLHKK